MSRRDTGIEGERRARAHLEQRGYRVVAANWRFGRWELDLVAEAPPGPWPVLAVVEVKTRAASGAFPLREALRPAQRRRLAAAAAAFVARHPAWKHHHVRFDAVLVREAAVSGPAVEHLTGAFMA